MIFTVMTLSGPETVWRLVSPRFAVDAFTGEGAKKYGGRWNRKGTPVVYVSSVVSLALLEMLVQADPLPLYTAIPAILPAGLPVSRFDVGSLPDGWRNPIAPEEAKDIGGQWMNERETCVLRVPSAVLPNESNYLLNPAHPGFSSVTIGPVQDILLDARLLRASQV